MARKASDTTKIPEGVREGDKNEVVIRGYHPEMAMIHSGGYNNSDPFLESHPKSQKLKYNGPKPVALEDSRPK